MSTLTAARPLVFLDSSVVAAYLRGDESSTRLLAGGHDSQFRFAINSVVLQEVLSLPEAQENIDRLEDLRRHVELLPVDYARAEQELTQNAGLRKRVPNSNDLLILSSAADCDFLVTYDRGLTGLNGGRPHVVTPDHLLAEVGGPE